jgi:regulator of sigma E protease
MKLAVKRGGEALNLELTPLYNPEMGRYMLGIEAAPGPTRQTRYGPVAALGPTAAKTWEFTVMIFDVLGKLTSGEVSANQLAGPLNIVPISGLMAFQGLSSILNFMALIGINLAVLNLLPLVITDGGLLLFLAIEAVRGKPLPVKAQAFINKLFMALFLGLFVFVSFNDIQRLPDFFNFFK